MKEEWAEEIFPGIYKIGNDASDTGGHQAILIERYDKKVYYLIFTDGFDYGSWLGKQYSLTIEEKEQVMNWKKGSYELAEWLRIRGERRRNANDERAAKKNNTRRLETI